MEFFALLLINVFLGVIFYLVITLKLEKSASDFREKRLREEMDKIIQEFNVTAERNISILESRIRTMKTLLEKTGDLKKVDHIIEDGPAKGKVISDDVPTGSGRQALESTVDQLPVSFRQNKSAVTAARRARETFFMLRDIIRAIAGEITVRFKKTASHEMEQQRDVVSAMNKPVGPGVEIFAVPESKRIERDYSEITRIVAASNECPPDEAIPAREDPLKIMSACKDRYTAISMLHEQGYPEKEISEYTGIPVGEIRLILNLNSSL